VVEAAERAGVHAAGGSTVAGKATVTNEAAVDYGTAIDEGSAVRDVGVVVKYDSAVSPVGSPMAPPPAKASE
jgi:hypothetical protein